MAGFRPIVPNVVAKWALNPELRGKLEEIDLNRMDSGGLDHSKFGDAVCRIRPRSVTIAISCERQDRKPEQKLSLSISFGEIDHLAKAQAIHMARALDGQDIFAKAVGDLALGLPIVLFDNEQAMYVLSAECGRREWVDEFIGRRDAVLVLTRRRANTLRARAYDGSMARIVVPDNVNSDWIRAVADPSLDLQYPMKGPLLSQRGGQSHLYKTALEMARRGRMLPAVLVCDLGVGTERARRDGFTVVPCEDAISILDEPDRPVPIAHADLPLIDAANSRIHVFRSSQGAEEHCAIEVGSPNSDMPVLARLHSSCFTGDVFGSLKCDCGTQLEKAISAMAADGGGVLLYLNQEGRGIGLVNKVRAYALQDQGFDTVEANHRLGFEDDERDFRMAADMLRQLGYTRLRLMTNNPAKISIMRSEGIDVVERIPIPGWKNPHNTAYIATKIKRSGHLP